MNMNKIGLLNVNECPPEIVYPYTSVNLCVTIGVQLSFFAVSFTSFANIGIGNK